MDEVIPNVGRCLIWKSIRQRQRQDGGGVSKRQLLSVVTSMDNYTSPSPQDGTIPPLFPRSNTSSTTLYFDAVPSMNPLFNRPRAQSRSSSPERGIKSISAPILIDSVQNPKSIHINGHTNMGDGEDDKTTLRAGGSTHGDLEFASNAPRQTSPVELKTENPVGMSRYDGDHSFPHDPASPSSRNRSLSRSEDHHGGATEERSLRSIPVMYNNAVPTGEDGISHYSQTDVSRKASVKKSPAKLIKRRNTKDKQTEYLVNGHSLKGEGSGSRRSFSRASQRSFRSSRGPVFDMVTAPPNATLDDAGGAFGTGAVMAAPENEVEEELRSEFQDRLKKAETSLTKKQTIKIHKEERALMR